MNILKTIESYDLKKQIYGIEYEETAFWLSTTNMLIHGDWNTNIVSFLVKTKIIIYERFKSYLFLSSLRSLLIGKYNWHKIKKNMPTFGKFDII